MPGRRGTGFPTNSGRGVGLAGGAPGLAAPAGRVGAPGRAAPAPGRDGAPERATICGFSLFPGVGRLGAAAGRGAGLADVGLAGGADGLAAAGRAGGGVGFAAGIGLLTTSGLLTSSGLLAGGFTTTGGFEGAGRGKGFEAVGRAGAEAGLAAAGFAAAGLAGSGFAAAAGRAGGDDTLAGVAAGLTATGLLVGGWPGATAGCAPAGLAGAGFAAAGLAGGAAFFTDRIALPDSGLLGAAGCAPFPPDFSRLRIFPASASLIELLWLLAAIDSFSAASSTSLFSRPRSLESS